MSKADTVKVDLNKLPKELAARIRKDGWQNTITALGTSRDKRSGTRIKVTPTNSSRTVYEDMFSGDDTAATIAELPPKEMTREWIALTVDEAKKEGVKTETVEEKADISKKIMERLEELGAKKEIAQALTWARVHGGSLLFLGVNDGVDELSEPLDLDNIKSLDFLLVFDRWEVSIGRTVGDLKNKDYGKAETYTMNATAETGLVGSAGQEVHSSRFIKFDGVNTSRYRKTQNGGWSDSVYTRMEEILQDYGITWAGVSHLMQDLSQAVLKMKGLSDAIVEGESNLVIDRMTMMDLCRSVARAIPIDAEDEDFMRVTTPLTGVADVIDRMMYRLSQAARIPAVLLFGQSPSGLNATGDSDIRLFYDRIKSDQEDVLRGPIDYLLQILFASKEGPTKGTEPESWSYKFNPLWQETNKEKAETRKTQAEADQIYLQEGVLDPDEVSMSRFGGDAYSTDTILDMEKRMADPDEDELEIEVQRRVIEAQAKKPDPALIPDRPPATPVPSGGRPKNSP